VNPRGRDGERAKRRRAHALPGPVLPPAAQDQIEELEARTAGGDDDVNTPPPVGGSWERLYTGVVLTLILYIVAFWLFTRVYAP